MKNSNDDQATRFWNKAASKYSKKPVSNEAAYEATLEHARTHLKASDRALEIGCGTGTSALKLAPAVASICASDLSSEMISIAKDKAQDQGITNVEFVVATLNSNSFEREGYDAVLAFNLLHLLEDLAQSLKYIFELTKPGGLFISKSPCLRDEGFPMRLIIPLLPLMRAVGQAPFVNVFDANVLRQEVASAGFVIEEEALYPTKGCNRFIVARKPTSAGQ